MKISPDQTHLRPPEVPRAGPLKGGEESLEVKKLRLRKATTEFESFFILQMLKAMRKTIPETDLLGGGLGQDVYTSLFDEELARTVAGSGPNSIADLLYKSLEKHLEKTASGVPEQGDETPTSIRDLKRPPRDASGVGEGAGVDETAVARPRSSLSARPRVLSDPILREFGATIARASQKFNVDRRLIYSIIAAESGGRADAVSPKGAKGLMQLTDSTAAEMGVADSLDPHQNIMGGTRYLRRLLDTYKGDVRLALAAYNAGPGTVSKYNGVPPYPETRRYVENVLVALHSGKK